MYYVPGTKYKELSMIYDLRNTGSGLMSNAERRSKNEEVGIGVLTQMAVLKLLGILTCLPVGRQDTNYLPAAAGNVQR